jgi:hypothetical protein
MKRNRMRKIKKRIKISRQFERMNKLDLFSI